MRIDVDLKLVALLWGWAFFKTRPLANEHEKPFEEDMGWIFQ
jgi:hypothetical protein